MLSILGDPTLPSRRAVAVVGARNGGIPEMVLDQETGRTFEPGNAVDLAEVLDWMESHPALMLEMGRAARRFVEERYSPDPHMERLEELYGQVTHGRVPVEATRTAEE